MPAKPSQAPIELREARLDKRKRDFLEYAENVLDRMERVLGLPPLGEEPTRPALTLVSSRRKDGNDA